MHSLFSTRYVEIAPRIILLLNRMLPYCNVSQCNNDAWHISVLLVRVATVVGECGVAIVTVSLVIVGDVQPVY